MGVKGNTERSRVLPAVGRFVNEVVSFLVFSVFDLLDIALCVLFKVVDFFMEAEWRPCYCSSSSGSAAVNNSGKILFSEQGGSKIVCVSSSNKLQLEDISDTLYTRTSLISEALKSSLSELRKFKVENTTILSRRRTKNSVIRSSGSFTVNSTIVEMLQGKIGKQQSLPRWSDCDCSTCSSWTSSCKDSLFVKIEGGKGNEVEDVLFIHGFISSSEFWTETVFPNFSDEAKSKYRLIAIDLLGFGRSPKPSDSLYTLREHVDMIDRVLEQHKVKSFHIVAHSLGSILALAMAAKHPEAIKSLTLLAPPYFPVPKGEQAAQYVMRRVAPRRVWPMISFGASLACWYEHISRTVCVLVSRNHNLWSFLTKLVTRNRIRTFLVDGFFCHTHNAAWHTLHNIICGTAGKIDRYLDVVCNQLKCQVTVFHGREDDLLPVECSYDLQSRIPRASVKVIEKKDHLTIVVGRQKAFAMELEELWKKSSE